MALLTNKPSICPIQTRVQELLEKSKNDPTNFTSLEMYERDFLLTLFPKEGGTYFDDLEDYANIIEAANRVSTLMSQTIKHHFYNK